MTQSVQSSESLIIVCCNCQAVRFLGSEDMKTQQWVRAESETLQHSPHVSHGYCPECYNNIVLPILEELEEDEPQVH
jgi:hypothetical protein